LSSTSSTCQIASPRGHDLGARLERPDGPVHATAVFAHCFTCSKDLKAARRLAEQLAARGIAVLSVDFTGLGASDGSFEASNFSTDVEDLLAAAGYLADTIAPPSLLVGHSLGGAAAVTAASRLEGVHAVATIGAPADVEHIVHLFEEDLDTIRERGEADVTLAGRQFTIRSQFIDDLGTHQLLDTVRDLDAALLFLHAPLDNVVGIDNARKLFEAARHPKSFISLHDADHLLSDARDARYAAEVIASWACRYLPSVPDVEDQDATTDPDGAQSTSDGSYSDKGAVATTGPDLAADVDSRGFRLRVGEPVDVGGDESGPSPYDLLAAALASCTSMTLRMYADRKDLPLESVQVSVGFDRVHADDCAECEFEDGRVELFTRTLTLTGDLDDDARASLASIADRCPVHRTLEGQIAIRTELAE
jgi:uncharacterized OsmC-like protein/fermentation-respiration switch protein FrsA (DUF1100 family)